MFVLRSKKPIKLFCTRKSSMLPKTNNLEDFVIRLCRLGREGQEQMNLKTNPNIGSNPHFLPLNKKNDQKRGLHKFYLQRSKFSSPNITLLTNNRNRGDFKMDQNQWSDGLGDFKMDQNKKLDRRLWPSGDLNLDCKHYSQEASPFHPRVKPIDFVR